MLAILNYEAGNQTSVRRALEYLDIPCTITADAAVLRAAQGVIFPGVGAAGQAMTHLQTTGMADVLAALVQEGKPLLGICLGCQILLEHSEENSTATLGLVRGQCVRFPQDLKEEDGTPVRIPHMGWNGLVRKQDSVLLRGVPLDAEFYFVHSYYVRPAQDMVIAQTHYGIDFCSVYGRDGLWAVQFHVEKSGAPGLQILRNFSDYCHTTNTKGAQHAQ